MKAKILWAVATLVTLASVVRLADNVSAAPKALSVEAQDRSVGAFKAVPDQISYQGYLVDAADSSAVNGTVAMTFRLFATETGGSELWSEVHSAVEVNNGLFYVLLGGVTPFPAGLFDGSMVWLQMEVGSDIFMPRKPLVSVPYSYRANSAEMLLDYTLTDLDNRWVNEGDLYHLNASDGDPANAVYVDDAGQVGIGTTAPGYTLDVNGQVNASAYYGDGSNLTGISGMTDNDWIISGNNIYRRDGNVGIGMTNPTLGRLVVHADSLCNWGIYALSANGIGIWGRNSGSGIGVCGDSDSGYAGYFDGNVYASGNMGIGTGDPSEETKLHVRTPETDNFGILVDAGGTWGTPGSEIGLHSATSRYASLAKNAYYSSGWQRFDQTSGAFLQEIQPNGDVQFKSVEAGDNPISWTTSLTLKTDGKVGIGTTSPSQSLDIDWGNILIQGTESCDAPGEEGIAYLGTTHHLIKGVYGFGVKIGTYAVGDSALTIRELSGNVGIGTNSPGTKLDVRGNIRISDSSGNPILELGEGLDYAEGFDVSGESHVEPGSVLILDPRNPGMLTVSTCPYDRKVAGIVAGAKGQGSGVRLGTSQHDFDVALAGRVYCNVETTAEGIEVGDLLTTSSVPGYAMKVTDHERAQGAILGKAMERLEQGKKGQILVLVTLQ